MSPDQSPIGVLIVLAVIAWTVYICVIWKDWHMTAKHRDPAYRKAARIIRANVNRRRALGQDVTCWRCGRPIDPQQSFDVGHIDPDGGHAIENLAPEHRYRAPGCRGNRSAGGSLGQRRQQHQQQATAGLLRW